MVGDQISKNVYWHNTSVTVNDRRESNAYKSCSLWFTGLSASGKSTIANILSKELHSQGINNYVLDGDNIRYGLNKDLGFCPKDRKENIRRTAEVASLFVDAGLIVMVALITPYKQDRRRARALFKEGDFIEIYTECSLEECEKRDPKGIYMNVRLGQIKQFTGISDSYEEPEFPEIVLETSKKTAEECACILLDYLVKNGYINNYKESQITHGKLSYDGEFLTK